MMSLFKTVAVAGLLVFILSAHGQVHRSDSGLGGALIVPYWTAANGNDTLLSIRNDSEHATAAKVRLLDDEGALLQSFNLYLNARSVWTSAITMDDGEPLLLLRDLGCVLPETIATDTFFSLPAVPLASPRGSVEIIEMARATNDSNLVSSGRWADCADLADEFESGSWSVAPNDGLSPPTQMLSASAAVINVLVGGMNTIAATALGGFSDVPQHTAPEEVIPDLGHAVDFQSDEGGTRSLVCTPAGCRIDEWNLPIQAVAAALMVSSMRVDHSILASLGAEFEWMIHRPLKRYEDEGSGFVINMAPTLSVRSREGIERKFEICVLPPPYWPPCGSPEFPIDAGLVQHSLALNAENAENAPNIIESPILGHPTIVRPGFSLGGTHTSAPEFQEGTLEVQFSAIGNHDQPLVANDGTIFAGEPVVSFAIQQFTNGMLTDTDGQNILANYRGTEIPRRILRLELPHD